MLDHHKVMFNVVSKPTKVNYDVGLTYFGYLKNIYLLICVIIVVRCFPRISSEGSLHIYSDA